MKYHLFHVAMIIELYSCIELFYVLPDNPTNVSCASEPCATLSQYLMNDISKMSNVKFLFLPGELNLASDIIIQDVCNVTMVGFNCDNLAPAAILCHSIEAVIVCVNTSNIMIANLMIKGCGGIVPKLNRTSFTERPATLFFLKVANVM